MNSKIEETTERRGHCLCGEVRIKAKQAGSGVGACHCKMCRRWGGGPFMEIDCGSEVDIEGQDNISIFDSSKWAERGFCRICGTHLFYRLKESAQHMVPVGLFEDEENLAFESQVFIDERPEYYEFANETKNLTGEEIFKMFGG